MGIQDLTKRVKLAFSEGVVIGLDRSELTDSELEAMWDNSQSKITLIDDDITVPLNLLDDITVPLWDVK